MDVVDPREGADRSDFQLAEWLIQPRLNRVSQPGRESQLEPKLMDVLSFLAEHPGDVVSKERITDAVWTDQFISESVITRAIAGLRRTLGDSAQSPRFIETISKRGYRLIAEVSRPDQEAELGSPQTLPSAQPAGVGIPGFPFVVGQWVRGERFYGRTLQIAEILDGNRNWVWLLGSRAVGKTSLLKQLEHLTANSPERGYFPLFWDMQGAEEPEELHIDFRETLLDAEERLLRHGIAVAEVTADDLFASLGRLRRKLRSKGLKLLLLCDEVEELIQLNQKAPALLRKFRRALQSREDIRSVLASSVRLWALAEHKEDTSPFLHGFTPPLFLPGLDDDEARALIRQTQLASALRPGFDEVTVEIIRKRCGNHPYLLQLLCQRCLVRSDLDRAIAEVAADRTVGFFFSVDFELLSTTERAIVRLLAEQPIAGQAIADRLAVALGPLGRSFHRLEHHGFIRSDEQGRFFLPNFFFRGWLEAAASGLSHGPSPE